LAANSATTLGFGSKFCLIEQLNSILSQHPVYPFFRGILSSGMDYKLKTELMPKQWTKELDANVKQGNHKSAESEPERVVALLTKDVRHGFSLPVLPSLAYKLIGVLVQPCGMVRQFALNVSGGRELKTWLT
jgi:hypothetical protein